MGTLRAGAAQAGAGGPAALLVVAETCRCFWTRGWGSTKWQLLTHLPTLFFFFFFWSFHKTFKSNKACSLFYEPASAALFFQPFPGCRAGVPCEVDGGIGCLPVVGRLPGDHVPSSQPPLPRLGQRTAGTDGHPGSFPTSPPAPGLCARTLRSPGHEQSPLPRGLDHVLLLSTKNSPVPSRSAQG